MYQTTPHEQDWTHYHFFQQSLTGWNPYFFFSYTGWHIKVKQSSLPNYLLIPGGRIVGCISFPRVFAHMKFKQPYPGF